MQVSAKMIFCLLALLFTSWPSSPVLSLRMSLLVSTKIYVANSGAATRVARDWRVVMIPDDIKQSLDVLGLTFL